MEEKQKYTVSQHFVPQVLLRGFSTTYSVGEKTAKSRKYMVWRYDTIIDEQKQVPTSSICVEDNIYEYTGKQGEFVLRNALEKILGKIESKFHERRNQLESKAFQESNYNTNCFLDKDEKDFWVLFITLQVLRDPEVIELASELYREICDSSLSEKQARNVALNYCVPFLNAENENIAETKLLVEMAAPMRAMNFHVLVDKSGGFISARRGIHIEARTMPERYADYELIVFPITAYLCMVLSKKKEGRYMNRLVEADEMCKEDVLYWLSRKNTELFSNHRFSKAEIAVIRGDRIPTMRWKKGVRDDKN